jgi:hypothetical protein
LGHRRAVSVALALAVALVLVAPLALATCQHCNDGRYTTSCGNTNFPIQASGLVTSRAVRWRYCFQGFWDSYRTGIECRITYLDRREWTFVPPWTPSYRIGIYASGEYCEIGRTEICYYDSSVTVIEYCGGFCEI